jgi:lysophospholipase L1-like esterase
MKKIKYCPKYSKKMNKNRYTISFLTLIMISVLSFRGPEKINIWVVGDSTAANKKAEVAPETGWAMVLPDFFNGGVKVHNHALNGRSSKSFMSEGSWKSVFDSLKKSDYVIIQFGHNDEKPDSVRHTEPFTTYKEILKLYIDEARSKGAIPIICSPIVRRHFDSSGKLKDTHGDYIKAAYEIANETSTVFIDMEAKTRKLVTESGQKKSKSLFLFCKPGEYINRPNGVQDSTHLNSYGAHQVAGLFIDGLKELKLPVVRFLK